MRVIVGAKMQRWGGRDVSEHHRDAVLLRPRACAGTTCQPGWGQMPGDTESLDLLSRLDRKQRLPGHQPGRHMAGTSCCRPGLGQQDEDGKERSSKVRMTGRCNRPDEKRKDMRDFWAWELREVKSLGKSLVA